MSRLAQPFGDICVGSDRVALFTVQMNLYICRKPAPENLWNIGCCLMTGGLMLWISMCRTWDSLNTQNFNVKMCQLELRFPHSGSAFFWRLVPLSWAPFTRGGWMNAEPWQSQISFLNKVATLARNLTWVITPSLSPNNLPIQEMWAMDTWV